MPRLSVSEIVRVLREGATAAQTGAVGAENPYEWGADPVRRHLWDEGWQRVMRDESELEAA